MTNFAKCMNRSLTLPAQIGARAAREVDMMRRMQRRTFLQTTGAAALGAPLAPEGAAFAQSQTAQTAERAAIPLGFDTYTLRAFHWKALELIDYAAGLKLDTIQISSLDDFESLEPAHLAQVKERAARHGMTLDGGIGCICSTSKSWNPKYGSPEQYLVKGMTVAHAIGAKAMRCFLGSRPDRQGPIPIEKHMETVIAAFRGVR